jgi:glycerol-3-phosphate acyltransferase PlsX
MVHMAVDAVGGDHAPEEIVAGEIFAGEIFAGEIFAGAIQSARDFNLRVSLVGNPDAIQHELSRSQTDDLLVGIVPACDVIHMDESPVIKGHTGDVLPLGHTGAGFIPAISNFGRIPVPR